MKEIEALEAKIKKLKAKEQIERIVEALEKYEISFREAEVIRYVLEGLNNKEAANLLFVTEKTVKFHLTSIYKKFDVKTRSQFMVKAMPLTLELIGGKK